MVIYDRDKNVCGIYEIKHSDKSDANQYRHLANAVKCEQTERRFGQIVSKAVLCRGESFETENGIAYRNVEEYLKNDISDFSLEQVVDNDIQSGIAGSFALPGFFCGKRVVAIECVKNTDHTVHFNFCIGNGL